jgi:hypothetical protein
MARNVVELRPRRASADPPDRWFEWRFEHDGAEVTVIESPSGTAPASQDAWLALGGAGELRVAALDGATPPPGAPMFCGLDGATWGAQVTRAALHSEDDIAVCLWRANRSLFDASITRAGARPQAAVVVADVRMRWDGDAHAQLVRASDCVAFARHGRRWTPVFPNARLVDDAAQVWDAWCVSHPNATPHERADAEDRALGTPSAWRTAAVGRFAEPLLERAEIEGFDELVLASDGARLELDRLDELDSWLDGLRRWERCAPPDPRVVKIHDDATVVRWRRIDDAFDHPSRGNFA